MPSRVRSKAIQGLLVASLGLCSSFSDAHPQLSEAPDCIIEELVDELEQSEVLGERGSHVLRRLAHDGSPAIRARVAEAAGQLWRYEPTRGTEILRELARDRVGAVRSAAARGLAHFLERASVPLRASVESEWTTSDVTDERVTIGLALGRSAPDWLTDLSIQELAVDERGSVRHAALLAAEAHLPRDPALYLRLGLEHVDDPDRAVRKAARRVVRRAERSGWIKPHARQKAQRADRRQVRRPTSTRQTLG